MIELLAIIGVVVALITELLLAFIWLLKFKNHENELHEYPFVDILVAARNEEANIAACIDSLVAIDYPKEKLKIWVGDDASTDNTWSIIKEYTLTYPFINGVQISEQTIKGNGKANVLAQLAQMSHGEWLFSTDADIKVPKQWIKAMLGAASTQEVGLITGTSLVEGTTWLAQFQRFEWLYATSMLKVVSDLGVPASTMGNNMAIKRSVYEEVGGYETIPFSVTEDLELFKQVKNKYATLHLFSKNVLNKSAAQQSLIELLKQRKRWMRGAFELPILLLSLLVIQASFFPFSIILIVLNPMLGIVLWVVKWFAKYIFLYQTARKLKEKLSIFNSFVLELFSVLFSLASLLYYFWPSKIHWKGRTY